MTRTIAIALSGGIDSLVSAYLLKKQGYKVLGLHFLTGYEPSFHHGPKPYDAPDPEQIEAVASSTHRQLSTITGQIDIPIEVIDLHRDFYENVIAYFTWSYAHGLTPNPCLVCNPAIKFGRLLEYALSAGASHLATGHYARLKTAESGRIMLYKGADPVKDQSYFLGRLTPRQLEHAVFPLGEFKKTDTIALAREAGLSPVVNRESQDICFISGLSYHEFLAQQLGTAPLPGPIFDTRGNHIGRHSGLHRFTIGQRRGINCPGPAPYYVIRIDHERNRLVVGFKADLFIDNCDVSEINWIIPPPQSTTDIMVRVRYRHLPVPARLKPVSSDMAHIVFTHPQAAITPGQGAVFYRGEQLLGAGWIVRSDEQQPHTG
ncbi:MAG: tRNA 2-thiouridine(34) synthase MnmA [Desulfobacteraceae bacterium]|nr:tRNA 2-thiouridine(34) synthase MnmA [Desulfobacteraceae bacterium]